MRSIWRSRTAFEITISSLIAFAFLVQPAVAWQFRDLDTVDDSVAAPATDLIDLVPTKEQFLAPVVDSDLVTQEVVDRAKASDLDADQGTVALEKKPVAKLEPVPMPEINKKPQPQPKPVVLQSVPKVEPANPMAAFSPTTTDGAVAGAADVETAKFNQVQPGTTSVAELKKHWGEPVKTVAHDDGSSTLHYKVPSFKQIDVATDEEDLVTAILVHLASPLDASHVEEELKLSGFAAVPIPDEYGEVLGQAYPERGLLFSFTDDIEELRVTAVLIEPVSGEMFRLRAQYDFEHQFTRSLADLDEAIRLDPADSEAHWLKAELLDAVGSTRDAVKAANKAIRLRPTNPLYRLTRARLYAKTNQRRVAMDEVQEVMDELDMPREIEAKAHALLGDLQAMGPDADHQEALKHHLKAIDLATKVVDTRRFAVRRMAKHILVDAHISVARDIAMGNFQRQSEVVPKWLLRATELADEFIADDFGDESIQMLIFRDTLASYAELNQANFDAAVASEEALQTGRKLIAEATDDLYKIQVERLLAETLLHSAKVARSRGRFDAALKYANNALALVENTASQWQDTSHDQYLLGQLYFLVGSVHAVQEEDHAEAEEWYTKAREVFDGSDFVSPLYTTRGHGEMYVSMGLSLWETGDQETAIKLSQRGADLMKKAVENGSLSVAALSVPYGNLATMHGKMGHNSKSQEFAKLVAKVEKTVTETKQR